MDDGKVHVFITFAPTTLVTGRVCLDRGWHARLSDESESANRRLQNAVGTAKGPPPTDESGAVYTILAISRTTCMDPRRSHCHLHHWHPSLEFVRGFHMEVTRLWESDMVQLEHEGGGRTLNCHHRRYVISLGRHDTCICEVDDGRRGRSYAQHMSTEHDSACKCNWKCDHGCDNSIQVCFRHSRCVLNYEAYFD